MSNNIDRKKTIFINGISAKSAGGKSILTNFLSLLKHSKSHYSFIVLVPSKHGYERFNNEDIKIFDLSLASKTFMIPVVQETLIPYFIKKYQCDLVFNLSDIPIPTKTRQIFLFDWAYAVYPESEAWSTDELLNTFIRYMKLYFFKRNLKYISHTIAQTDLIKNRLYNLYHLKNISVIPNAVSLDNLTAVEDHNWHLGTGLKLLCLSRYYTHKNIEIFIPLAKLIKHKSLNIKIIITIEENQGVKAAHFLQVIKGKELDDIIINLGPVSMNLVPSLYQQTDGLLLPTLLESFSGTYVEALYHRKTIYTSNLDFARAICKDAAYYFDPFDANDILNKITESIEDKDKKTMKINKGGEILESLPSWEHNFKSYLTIFENQLGN